MLDQVWVNRIFTLESAQSSLPLEVESSLPEPAGGKRSQSTQAVASGHWSVASECEAGETAVIEDRQDRHQFFFGH